VGGHFVDYQNYLFELEDYVHYYETQQGVNFSTSSGQKQLDNYKQRALDKVVDDAYIQELANENDVTVSNQQINNQITIDREENRLGSSQAVFENVLKTYYGWSINDFKRELKTTLLAQNLVSKLDTGTHQRAETALKALQGGADFSTLAQQDSDDQTTKANGGQYGFLISQNNVSIPSQVVQALFKLQPGQITGIINTGYSLEIDKVVAINNNQIQAAHIVFNFQDISTYLNPLKEKQPARVYIKIP
jgi:parvulin-like peptidyl-prolyl isomerase